MKMTVVNVPLNGPELETLIKILDGEIFAHKNWIAGNVEERNFDRAVELTRNLRHLEDIRMTFRGMIRYLPQACQEL